MQSRRFLTVAVACVGLALAIDTLPRRLAEPGPDTVARENPAAAEIERVAGLLGEWNPHLVTSDRERIARAVQKSARSYELPTDLVMAVIFVESNARPGARSPKGALGLMQVMPHMQATLDLVGNSTTIESNVEAGCQILADNIRRLGEDRGILAYFWGSKRGSDWYLRRVRSAQHKAQLYLEAPDAQGAQRAQGKPRSEGSSA